MNAIELFFAIIIYLGVLSALFFFDANPVIWVIFVLLFWLFGKKLRKYLP